MAGEAKVYILDIPYHADKAYSYYIPDAVASQICPGAIVEVPFGRGNRRMTRIYTVYVQRSTQGYSSRGGNVEGYHIL